MIDALANLTAAVAKVDKAKTDEIERDEQGFGKRIRIQQFLNQNGPIFRVYAAGKLPVSELVEGSALRDYAEKVRRLSIAVACGVQGTTPDNVDPVMVRNVAPSIADFVAERILADIPIDLIRDTATILSALDVSDSRFDVNPFEGTYVARDATVKMTVAGAVAGLLGQLAWHDFRSSDLPATLARLKDALTGRVVSIVTQVAPDADERTRIALTQSFLKHYAPVLENALARVSAETLAALRPLNGAQRLTWYAENDPVGSAIQRFNEVASAFDASVMIRELFETNPAAFAAAAQPAPETP
ncbi:MULTISPECIES: hypothetical protein [unclassified Bradyrhizobium]